MPVRPETLRALVEESLALWGVAGCVVATDTGFVVSAAGDQVLVRPHANGDGLIRWFVTANGCERPCTSVVGVLRVLRAGLVAEEAAPRLRIGAGALAP